MFIVCGGRERKSSKDMRANGGGRAWIVEVGEKVIG
jgi:hypothetical protein